MKDSRNLVQMGDEYGCVISRWGDGYLVRPQTIINGGTIKPVFSIRNRKGRFVIYLSGIAEQNPDLFSIKTRKPVSDYTGLQSNSLKKCATFISAVNWIARFMHLTEEEQLAFFGRHDLKERDTNSVVLFCKYFRLEKYDSKLNKWLDVTTSINARSIEVLKQTLESGADKFRVRNTTSRHYHMGAKEYAELKASGVLDKLVLKESSVKNAIGTGKTAEYRGKNNKVEKAQFWASK